jgi:hypothetical protein
VFEKANIPSTFCSLSLSNQTVLIAAVWYGVFHSQVFVFQLKKKNSTAEKATQKKKERSCTRRWWWRFLSLDDKRKEMC